MGDLGTSAGCPQQRGKGEVNLWGLRGLNRTGFIRTIFFRPGDFRWNREKEQIIRNRAVRKLARFRVFEAGLRESPAAAILPSACHRRDAETAPQSTGGMPGEVEKQIPFATTLEVRP